MMMPHLPAELVEEILSRVPAKSLKRLRSTCKQGNTLLKNRGFTEKHFRKAPKQSLVLILNDYRVCPMSINLNVVAPSIEFKRELSLKDFLYSSIQVDITTVFHCDGLLLCTTNDDRLVVWNPCLGETRWIQLKADYEKHSMFALGYQNNKSCRSYKILRCWNCNEPNIGVAFEIYEFSSDSWRFCDNVCVGYVIKPHTGVSFKVNTYWVTFNERSILASFDFTTERFKRVYLPPIENLDWKILSIVREEELSVLIQKEYTSKMEIWVANNIETEATLSWKKSFTVDIRIRTNSHNYTVCHSFLIEEEKKVVVCCNERNYDNMIDSIGEDDDYYTRFPFVQPRCWPWRPCIFNYVPSLVQIRLR